MDMDLEEAKEKTQESPWVELLSFVFDLKSKLQMTFTSFARQIVSFAFKL